ncbi:MAG: hypothetical protein JNK08_07455 [Sediminibacterium sp.]|nr:hypothetical protein [Sediminibacterium sp.]
METNKLELLIVEPWDAYKKIGLELVNSKEGQFLFKLLLPLNYKGKKFDYLIGSLRNTTQNDSFMKGFQGIYVFNLFYDEELNEGSFNNLDTLKFRGNFLLGEITL